MVKAKNNELRDDENPMNWKLVCGFVLLLLLGLASACGGGDGEAEQRAAEQPVSEQTEAQRIPIQIMFTAFRGDTIEAQKKYRGKLVIATAPIEFISEREGKPVVTVKSSQGAIALCTFSPEWADQVAKLTRGQEITLQGIVQGADRYSVYFDECTLE